MMTPTATSALAMETMIANESHLGATAPIASSTIAPEVNAIVVLSSFTAGSDLARDHSCKQPLRAQREHERHDRVNDEELHLRQRVDCRRARNPDEQCADQRTRDAPQAADDDDGERDHDHFDADSGYHRERRRG